MAWKKREFFFPLNQDLFVERYFRNNRPLEAEYIGRYNDPSWFRGGGEESKNRFPKTSSFAERC
jgi:hypothetical protein